MIPTINRLGLLAGLTMAITSPAAAQQQVNLYTTREPGLIKPLLEQFTKTTGIKVNTVFVKNGLGERVRAEGKRSPADVLMTVDYGKLLDLVEKGITQPVKSEILEKAIPANLRDPKGHWFSMSMRARIVYADRKLGLKSITYENLADPKWKGAICIRSGQHPYNTGLIAAYIAHHGLEKTETWLKGVKANLARKPGGNDRAVARDILGGICKIGIGNSYYVGLMRSGAGGEAQKKWGSAIDAILPTFEKGGAHVNISGASVALHSPNRANAVKLLEFLVSDAAQAGYAEGNYEYPVKQSAKVNPIIAALGKLTIDSLPVSEIVKHRKQASDLVDRVRFNN
ncbi:MAG: extracellular solute-binding protein [Hyphomicrobiales bacterium]|nr:extracellular solute-binding protein [Hyphomicrobiales bacterium]